MIILQYIVLIFLMPLAFIASYLLLLTLTAWFAKSRTWTEVISRETLPRFVFLIPAHNEEKLISECLASLAQVDYPANLYAVLVVADNCQDDTAGIARGFGAQVTERVNPELRGKGYALEWGMAYLREHHQEFDAVIVLDADTTVSSNFLQVMASRLARGERVIQAYYSVRNAYQSSTESLRYMALTVLHFLRPQARMVLGGSAGLKGNGMAFTREILESHTWSASVTEDIEFHMALLLDGERVTFAPDAVAWGEMPNSLTTARSQVDRWEHGRIEMARIYIPRLMQAAWRAALQGQWKSAYLLFDAVMEHAIPPFSLMVGLAAIALAAAAALALIGPVSPITTTCLLISIAIVLIQIIYVISGLILAKAPRAAYLALLYTPVFILWKIWQYLRVLLNREQKGWVRTARNGG